MEMGVWAGEYYLMAGEYYLMDRPSFRTITPTHPAILEPMHPIFDIAWGFLPLVPSFLLIEPAPTYFCWGGWVDDSWVGGRI